MPSPFTDAERAIFRPPEDMPTTEWAERFRILSPRVSASPGPYRVERTPYARGIMDALSDEEHREVWLQKPVQSSGSEMARCWIGRGVDLDPGPVMIVFPSEATCLENMTERVRPMFEDSPRLRATLTGRPWDVKTRQIALRSATIYVGWAGSAAQLASRPIRYLLLDEVDKYPKWRGVEADAISLAKDRTLTYRHRRKVFGVSTPTTPNGNIAKAIAACGDVRYYHVRCRHCGELDRPEWERVVWEGRDEADEDALRAQRRALESGELVAYYRCGHCEKDMTQDELTRASQAGCWVSDGFPEGEHPNSESLGFVLSGIVSPWIGVDRLAVEYVAAKLAGLGEMQNFYNSFLGIPFWDEESMGQSATQVSASTVWTKSRKGHRRGQLPDWAQVVVCGADSKGKGGHQYVVRAFGQSYRSRLLDYGETETSAQLYDLAFGRDWVGEGGRILRCRRLCVDVGGTRGKGRRDSARADDVYRWCKTDPARLFPVKGHGGDAALSQPIVTSTHTYHPPGESRSPYDVTLSVLDVEFFKDLLAGRICSEDDELWEVPVVGRDYVLQICAERKVLVERRVRDHDVRDIWRWVPRAKGMANHYWDAEVYATAAAYMLDLDRPSAPVNTIPYEQKGTRASYAPRGEKKPSSWRVGR